MGAGKTRTTIEIINEKNKKHGRILKTLVIAPAVVTFTWKKEFAAYSNIKNEHVLVLHGTGAERLKQLERTPNYFVVVCNYETLLMDKVFEALRSWGPEITVGDESQRLKNPRAQRTKRAIAVSQTSKYRYILSGTPILVNQADLFSQFMFLDHGKTLGKNFFTFRNLWFTDKNQALRQKNKLVTWPEWVPKKSKEEEFQKKIMSLSMSVKKSECMDLPPYIQQTIEVGMTKEQERAYKQMRDDYIAFIGSKAFTAQLAITKAMRLAQITSGFLMNEEGKIHSFENTPKEKALLELIEDSSGKVVVWAHWRANQASIGRLLTKAGIEFRELLGNSSAVERQRALQDFSDKPDVRVMLASQMAGGVGISLVAANKAIYYSRGFSFEADSQSAARTYRGGSAELHQKVYRIDLCVPGTIDQATIEALAKKEDLSDQLIFGKVKV